MRTPWARGKERRAAEAASCNETARWLQNVIAETDEPADAVVTIFSAVAVEPV